MKKKIDIVTIVTILLGILLAVLVIFCVRGCSRQNDALNNSERFILESGGNNIGLALVTDKETGVQYLYNVHSGVFTVLLDHDGKPYIKNGWRDY